MEFLKNQDVELFRVLLDFYTTWNHAESIRGCYSCAPTHDSRCHKDRGMSDVCTCYREALEILEGRIDTLLRLRESESNV